MTTPYILTVCLLASFLIASCELPNNQLHSSHDFTAEDEFTSGVEGPATDFRGNLYAVNYEKQGTIGIVSAEGDGEIFVHLPEGSTGNGIRLNRNGDLLVADYTGHNILQIDVLSKNITVYANNDSMNQPNDLAIAKSGQLFLSDPNWSESTGNLWRVDVNGETHLLEANMGTTNGVEVSPDEGSLYVNESVQRNVWVYDLTPQGEIQNKRLLIQFPDYGMDGMRCDAKGDLYITRHGKGTVVVLSPDGEIKREILLKGKKPTNIAFGGKNGKTCYVTMMDRGNVEFFRAEHPGREWVWSKKEEI